MTTLESIYQDNSKYYRSKTASLKKRLITLSAVRLVVFITTVVLVYFTFINWQISVFIGVVGLSIFLYLLSIYTKIKRDKNLNKLLAKINKEEIKYLNGFYHDKDEGRDFKNPEHYYSDDIDLFGTGSFFQYINRTATDFGRKHLAKSMLANNTMDIVERQNAIKELAQIPEWRQNFTASAQMIHIETDTGSIENWISNYRPFLNTNIKYFPLVFSLLSIAVFGLIYLQIIGLDFLLYWLILGLVITGVHLKKIAVLSRNCDKARDTIRQFASLLKLIESHNFQSGILQTKKEQLSKDGEQASILFKKFSSALDTLDNRNNFIYAIFGNGYFLTDIRNAYKVEGWLVENQSKVTDWFKVIAFFDAFNSLGNFAYNHPQYAFPLISEGKFVIKAKNIGHPLLKTKNRIDNDISIKPEEFFIITGANMAGKSTFLRTVSLHIVMANIGLPVCAEKSEYTPIKLISSMRTSDSLKDDSSYFFSELTRLKFIVDAIEREPYFIVLDEILKGTNSTDKAIGSKKFVEKLVSGNATGIIATHDLSLCEIEKDLPDVKNYFFDAQIINDELYFDYTFKQGICQNMNASFLLKKMGIV